MLDQPAKENSASTDQPRKAWRKPSVRSLKAVSTTSAGSQTGIREADLTPGQGTAYTPSP